MTLKTKKSDCIEQQDILQAVVIADNFTDRLLPLTYENPAVLFPLVNKVLLDYSLEALAKYGIQETYVFCCSHVSKIRDYINSKWAKEDSAMTVTVLSSESFISVGDVIRELDAQALIRSDFVLISGTTVTTLNLINILEEHKKCRKLDKGCSMTLIYRKALPKHRTRCLEDDVVIAVESSSSKVRFYQKIKKKKTLHIPLEVFQENSKVTVHYDLLNCHMCICSPSVPPLYSDNFDYQTLDDLIRGLIINEEILGSSMYLHIANSGYAANISNLSMYDVVSRDIIQRWSYPVVPDLFAASGSRFWYHRHNIYKEGKLDLDRTCKPLKNTAIGKGTSIGESTSIEDSVVGRNCKIGANVTIKGCYLWDNVTVGDNCQLEMCLLANNVVLREHVIIPRGCVLSHEVFIDDHVELPPFTKLQSKIPEDNDGFGDSDCDIKADIYKKEIEECEPKLVGASGRGYLYTEPDDSDNEDEVKDIWGDKQSKGAELDDDDDSVERLTASQASEDNLYDEEDGLPEEEDTLLFYNEVLDSLQRGIEEKIKSENLILEINSSKYAYNVTMKEVNTLVMKAILTLPLQDREHVSPQEYFTQLKPILSYLVQVISNYIKNAVSQLECLQSIEDFADSNEGLAPTFGKVLHFLYENEILNENVILKWFAQSAKVKGIRQHLLLFIKWLREADEESSSEE